MAPDNLATEMIVSPAPWAKRALSDDPHITLETFQKGLTVSLIATERSKFETCDIEEPVVAVVERNRLNSYDFVPVTERSTNSAHTHQRIVGLIELASYMRGTAAT